MFLTGFIPAEKHLFSRHCNLLNCFNFLNKIVFRSFTLLQNLRVIALIVQELLNSHLNFCREKIVKIKICKN